MKSIHPNLTAALDDPTGLAVLGFFIDVSLNNFVLFVLYIQAVAVIVTHLDFVLSCRLFTQTMCTLDTYHKSCPPLLTKVRGHSQNMNSSLLFVLFVTLSSLRLCILPQGQTTKVKPFPLMSLLPKHNMSQYYRYYGSLTTPPCSRVVVWTLYEVPIYISWSQVGLLSHFCEKKTNI